VGLTKVHLLAVARRLDRPIGLLTNDGSITYPARVTLSSIVQTNVKTQN